MDQVISRCNSMDAYFLYGKNVCVSGGLSKPKFVVMYYCILAGGRHLTMTSSFRKGLVLLFLLLSRKFFFEKDNQ